MKTLLVVLIVLSSVVSVYAEQKMQTVEELEAQILALQDTLALQMGMGVGVEEEPTAPTSMKAQLFAGLTITEYKGYFDFERIEDGVMTGVVRGEFRLNSDRLMTILEINGVELFRDYDHPRPAVLPANAVGQMRNFYAYISAREGREEVAWGSFHEEYLGEDEGVNFSLRLGDQFQLLEFPVGDIPGEDLVVMVNGSQVGYYDSQFQAFRIWLNPNLGVVEYQILNQWTGEVLQVGTLSPVDQSAVTPGSVLNITLDDGIEVVDLNGDDTQYFYRGFPGQETLDDISVSVKVFILERGENVDTYFYLEGFRGDFVVKAHQDQGEMPIWPIEAQGYGSYTIPAGPEKLVIIFYGNEDSDGKFFTHFYGGGGGLG